MSFINVYVTKYLKVAWFLDPLDNRLTPEELSWSINGVRLRLVEVVSLAQVCLPINSQTIRKIECNKLWCCSSHKCGFEVGPLGNSKHETEF